MHAPSPARRLLGEALRLLRRFFQEVGQDDLASIAAAMTYYFMLALLPLMILSVALVQALPWEVDVRSLSPEFLSLFSPDAAGKIEHGVRAFLAEKPSSGLLLWILPVLWAASRATGGARKGLNRVFRCRPRRNLLVLRLADLGLTIAALLLVLASNAVLVGGRELGQWLVTSTGMPRAFLGFWSLLRWPAVFGSMVGILALAYRHLPSRKVAWRFLFLGAVPAVMGWVALATFFRLWMKLLGGFDKLYGGMATFFVLMFLFWLISLVMLLGGEVAARAAERAKRAAERRAAHGAAGAGAAPAGPGGAG